MESTHGTKTLQRGSTDPRGTVGDSRLPSVQFETVAGGNPPVQHLHPTPQSGTLGAETWFTQMVRILTCQHRSLYVQKVTHTLAYLLRLAEAPNPLPQARNQVGGVAHAALRRGCCEIQALQWVPKRLSALLNIPLHRGQHGRS